MPGAHPADSFNRQRRNLLTASTALALIGGAELRIEQLPIWDNAFNADKVWVLYLVIWAVCFYCLLGFVVHLLSERSTRLGGILEDAKRSGVRQYLHRLGQKRGGRAEHTETPDPVSVWPMDIEVEIHKHFEAERLRGTQGEGGPAVLVERDIVQINRPLWAALVLRGVLLRLGSGTVFLEYVLPLLWFLLALCIANGTDWPGAFHQIWQQAFSDSEVVRQADALSGLSQTLCVWPRRNLLH
ncbi:hypothetical protein GT347_24785 [Xylophilus rhododendri]|uniref:Uncharacterized protein n=1 Tax=Xylophilus rhododendri TaxID=2697032 RepID=A0A857JD86_9BURK|nr:hypothetical protein [Xylophilus rhododendri]QHJ00923.1 hypothetical protein GT347_24785 [Xylophilus rhododendri]